MKHKRLAFCIFILLIFISCMSSAEDYDIWGVWNLGNAESADIPFGDFLRTWKFLYFSNENIKRPFIGYDGGRYEIKKIISRKTNEISFFLEHEQTIMNENNELVTGIALGKVIMHFIDKDSMWLDLDYNDKEYPTDEQFSDGDFRGPSAIFWRAQRIRNK